MGSRQPGAMVAMRTTCPFSGSRRSGWMWMPGTIASLSSGIWSMLTVSRSSCGKATNGSGTPLLVRNMPGETGADMWRNLSRRCTYLRSTYFRMLNRISGLLGDCTVTRPSLQVPVRACMAGFLASAHRRVDPGRAVTAPRIRPDLLDLLRQLGIGESTRRHWPADAVIERRHRHPAHSAQRRHPEFLAVGLHERYGRRRASWAKTAGQPQDLIGAAQLDILPPQPGPLRQLSRGRLLRGLTTVRLVLAHLLAGRLRTHAQLAGPLRDGAALRIPIQLHSTRPELRRVLAWP